MDARGVIAGLRRGEEPDAAALEWFAAALADGRVSDAQAGAFAMAVCWRGLSVRGRVALTRAICGSGRVLTWDLDAPVLDKHSTGGVGDCVSLVLAPALAACGVCVPMISGRGLGHTGGTLDKLEAIPGVVTALDEAALRKVVAHAGCAIAGAGKDLAPADRRLYAVRDVTATIDSVDLICASILSKKLAAGVNGLVLDVKVGSGAFMKTEATALALAQALVDTASASGCRATALITGMEQPVASALGNALEVAAAMRVLAGEERGALADLSEALGGVLLHDAGLCESRVQGAARIAQALASGAAAERFGRMVAQMGGPLGFIDDWTRHLPAAPVIREVAAPDSGVISGIDGEALGLAVVALGGGRKVETDAIDPAVGISDVVRLGARVTHGQVLARVHAASAAAADAACGAVRAAFTLGAHAETRPLVRHLVTPGEKRGAAG